MLQPVVAAVQSAKQCRVACCTYVVTYVADSLISTFHCKQRICYCRVSSQGQKDDLERQINYMRQRSPDYTIITGVVKEQCKGCCKGRGGRGPAAALGVEQHSAGYTVPGSGAGEGGGLCYPALLFVRPLLSYCARTALWSRYDARCVARG